MHDDRELFIHWAAEEFVAAGRVEDEEGRVAHRRKAEFYIDICRGMRGLPPAYTAPPWNGGIAQSVVRALVERGDDEGLELRSSSLAPSVPNERRR